MIPPRVLFIGRATLDVLYSLDQFPAPDTKTFAQAMHAAPGGPATNAAITHSLLGGSAILMTPFGAVRNSADRSSGRSIPSYPDHHQPAAINREIEFAFYMGRSLGRGPATGLDRRIPSGRDPSPPPKPAYQRHEDLPGWRKLESRDRRAGFPAHRRHLQRALCGPRRGVRCGIHHRVVRGTRRLANRRHSRTESNSWTGSEQAVCRRSRGDRRRGHDRRGGCAPRLLLLSLRTNGRFRASTQAGVGYSYPFMQRFGSAGLERARSNLNASAQTVKP